MTPAQFLGFRQDMGLRQGPDEIILSERKTATLLGTSRNKVHRWSTTDEAPLYVDYACQAIVHNLTPYGADTKRKV